MSPLEDHERYRKAWKLRDELVASLLERRPPSTFLYPSNYLGPNPSPTVSSIALLAFAESMRREADFVCEDLLAARTTDDGENVGAWAGENGTTHHCMSTAWPMFACLRRRPSAVLELESTAKWFLKHQTPDGGWGHSPGQEPKPFFTCYALNGLIEFSRCGEIAGLDVSGVRKSIEHGFNYLLGKRDKSVGLWSQDGGAEVCSASSSIALHVVTKAAVERFVPDFLADLAQELLEPGVRRLGGALHGTLDQDVADIEVPGSPAVSCRVWSSFEENAPGYWYRFFTPIAAVTLLSAAKHLKAGEETRKLLLECAGSHIDWILEHSEEREGGLTVSFRGEGGSTKVRNWTTAQAIIAIGRWLAFADEDRQPAVEAAG